MKLFRDEAYAKIAQSHKPETDIEKFVRSVYHDNDLQRALNAYVQRDSLRNETEDLMIYFYARDYLRNVIINEIGPVTQERRFTYLLKIYLRSQKQGTSNILVHFTPDHGWKYNQRFIYSFVEKKGTVLMEFDKGTNYYTQCPPPPEMNVEEFSSRLILPWLRRGTELSSTQYSPNKFLPDKIRLKELTNGLERAITLLTNHST